MRGPAGTGRGGVWMGGGREGHTGCTHTRTHTHQKQKVERLEKKSRKTPKIKRGDQEIKKKEDKKAKDEKKRKEKKEEMRERGGEGEKIKREGNGLRGIEERGY